MEGIKLEYSQLYIDRIRSLCRARRISVNKLAEMSAVRQSTLDNIMRAQTKNPRVQTLHKIALAFGMTLSEFLDFPALNEYEFEESEAE